MSQPVNFQWASEDRQRRSAPRWRVIGADYARNCTLSSFYRGYNARYLAFLIRVRETYGRNSVIESQLSEALFDRNFRWLEVYCLNFSGPRFEPATRLKLSRCVF